MPGGSLRAVQDEVLADACRHAMLRTERESGLLRDMFFWAGSSSFDEAMDDGFWPEPG